MPKSEVNALTLVIVFIAAALSQTLVPLEAAFAQPLFALILLIILFSFDREGHRDMGQSLGFGAVAGFCAARVVTPFLGPVLSSLGALPWFTIIWIVAGLVLWAVDISRMAKRAAAAPSYLGAAPAAPIAPAPVPSPVVAAVQPRVREEPVRVQPPPPPPAPPIAAPVRSTGVTSIFSQPASSPPVSWQPEPAVQAPVSPAPTVVAAEPAPPPQSVAVPRGSGKPTTIYLHLVGEGIAVLRSVQAEHLGKDYYLIVEPMPEGENWEFKPGQVVRCQKRNLSSGKALVAVEEAPRAS